MIYRSNLEAPDLAPYFKLKDPPLQINGHDIPSDPDFEPGCGYWSHDEAAILYNVARKVGGNWVDLGARFGWTAAHIAAAGCVVFVVDREYERTEFLGRMFDNVKTTESNLQKTFHVGLSISTSAEFLRTESTRASYDGFVIDADHDAPQPLLDAIGCERIGKPDAVILLHDFWGQPVRDAVTALLDYGWRARIYDTPNGVALCWRGFGERCSLGSTDFHPPHHVPDPAINWREMRARFTDFDFTRCE